MQGRTVLLFPIISTNVKPQCIYIYIRMAQVSVKVMINSSFTKFDKKEDTAWKDNIRQRDYYFLNWKIG